MKTKLIVNILIVLSSLSTLLWVLGLIFAEINLFIIAMILSAISLVPTMKFYSEITEFFKLRNGEVIDDERKQFIEGKASLASFATMLVISIYSGIAILTLRNLYPQYTILAYAFLSVGIIGLLAFTLSKAYYNIKYGS